MGIIVALVAFAVMVFIHELGHFLSAKMFKIKVLEFAIGMGPAIFKKKKGETLYSVRCLPFGGYCSMEGESESSDDERSFSRAAWWKRLIVVAAGAILNIVLGLVLLIIVQSNNEAVRLPVVNGLEIHANMDDAGFQKGDRIIKLDNTKINIYEDVQFFLERVKDKEVNVTVERDGEIIKRTVKPSKELVKYNYYEDKTDVEIYVNDHLTQKYSGEPTDDLSYIGKSETQERYILGFECETVSNSFGKVMSRSFYLTGFYVKMVYVSVYELITGQIPANQISGPVGVVDVIGKASKIDVFFLLEMLALLTINLGIMNLLPIPALDGCKILIILIELITRKKVPPEKEGIINLIGFMILIGIMIFATYNDISRLFA